MDEFTLQAGEGWRTYLPEFLRNDQVALPDCAPFLRVHVFPTFGLGSEAGTLADLQAKEPGLILNASGLGEGGGKSADFQKSSQPVYRRVKHLNDYS